MGELTKLRDRLDAEDPQVADWPTLDPAARIGLVGELYDMVEGETEADPVGIVIAFLAAYGNLVGDSPTYMIEATPHHAVIFAVNVGETAKSRKGQARDIALRATRPSDTTWADRIVGGHASGEAIIADLGPNADGHPPDPRLFVVEREFSRLLKAADRPANILSDTIRNLWDGTTVANRRASGAIVAKRHHVSIVGETTREDLARTLSDTDAVNGFGNRFLWVMVRRQDLIPLGGNLTPPVFNQFAKKVNRAAKGARQIGDMDFDAAGEQRYIDWYRDGNRGTKHGLWAAVTARDEPYVLRLAMIYALSDGLPVITERHVNAAIAVWDYCDASARLIFGDRSGDRDVDKLHTHLAAVGHNGLDGRGLDRLFAGNSTRAAATRERAVALGIAVETKQQGERGAPRRIVYAREYAPDQGRETPDE